jgi:uncharacterized phosphosugar-binding protein
LPSSDPSTSSPALAYFDSAMALLQKIKDTQVPAIQRAAKICAERIAAGGLIFLFGSGHSRMMSEEMTPRQGCFVGFYALVEHAISNHAAIIGPNGLRPPLFLEKYEGYAEEILKSFKFGPSDAFIIISTSGIRPVIVEMARGVKERGMPVIALVSKDHCETVEATHSSGKKLIDYADVVLDNVTPRGDCILELPGLDWKTGPASTLTGAMIINMLRCETARLLVEAGHHPVMLPSHQFVGNVSAEEQLERFYEGYRLSLRHLYE